MLKTIQFKTKGMQRDLSASAFNSEYSYENKNVRIIPTNENTLLSLVNERGNKKLNISGVGDHIKGIPIGQSIINDDLVIFTSGDDDHKLARNIIPNIFEVPDIFPCNIIISNLTTKDDTVVDINAELNNISDITFIDCPYKLNLDIDSMLDDRIYKLWFNNLTNLLSGKRLFRGELGFNYKYPIETISFYENDDIRKVYWTDGLNLPRVINIASEELIIKKWNSDSFNFVRTLKLQEKVHINKNTATNGSFSPGVILYSFTYFNKYGLESNIFYTSPMYYISYNNRGASPEDKVSNCFNIEIQNIDTNFDYLRIYSIHRSSINATPYVKRVMDLPISNINKIYYIDNGLSGDSVDPTELLYIGGEEVVFGTMSHKDNTLFLGDIKIKRKPLSRDIINYFRDKDITFSLKDKVITPPDPKGYYPYDNQLKMNSYQFKTFKYLEYYRFGILALHYTGKWSEPIWINDIKNYIHIDTTFYENNVIKLPIAEFILNDKKIINMFIESGYIRIRPVVVYPTINDREVICLGILCPTVYNVSDRYSNSPFAQSSWFTRPNAPFDEHKAFNYSSTGTKRGDWSELGLFLLPPSIYSRAGIMSNNRTKVIEGDNNYDIDITNKGAWAEFRHNKPIPGNDNRNAEILCIWNPPTDPYILNSLSDPDITNWVSNNSENYYIDLSIVTLHSPDIEFNDEIKNIDTSNLKLRIVGMVPITSFVSDIDIQTSTPVNNFYNSSELPIGFYKEPIGVENDFSYTDPNIHFGNSHFGWKGLISGAFWFDELSGYKKDFGNTNKYTTGFVVYPWHRNGSLNNTKFATDGYKSAMLDKKKLSNLRYSYKSLYFDRYKIWNAYSKGDSLRTGISGVSIFDSNEVSLVKVPAPENSNLADINYYGNVDKVISVSRIGDKKEGYPIITTGVQNAATNSHDLFSGEYKKIDSKFTDQTTGIDPVRIKYKSTPHAVLALNYSKSGGLRILPTLKDGESNSTWIINDQSASLSDKHMFWDKYKKTKYVGQDVLENSIAGPIFQIKSSLHGWLWLGELYNDDIKNRFGGQTKEAFENNLWIPCGDPVSIIGEDKLIKNEIVIRWEEGDTYFQRYDHIKTYPFTFEDQNSVTDIVSFMCETRVNIDGRYDKNRGLTSNLVTNPSNFNLINNVYSLPNNFFNYRILDSTKFKLDNFYNSITWTKTKTSGELVDTWTNITLASTIDLDGDKGPVRSLKRLNNNIYAFQDKGISQILYNENMQITSTEGVPIEIANSGKVNGKRYISDNIGCTNKWSICSTSNGLYFIDDITKGIFLFNGLLTNLSDKLGFHSWINKVSNSIDIWNPVDFKGFVTYYDKVNGDVFFINKDECLAYSEPLEQFSSFYSYEKTPYFSNLLDKGISFNVKDKGILYRPWLHNEGDYNMFFDKYLPFYTTIIANPNMSTDKIFNTVEFRADSWDKNDFLLNTTFDTLDVWNEYLKGKSDLVNISDKPSNLKRKFRIWRANIPRSDSNGRDRIRNPWLYIKLSMNKENKNKTILHDMIVHYFE